MSTAETPLSAAPSRHSGSLRFAQSLLGRFGSATEHLPGWVFARGAQLTLDVLFAAAALFGAYQLRFEGEIPAPAEPFLWSGLLFLVVARPLALWGAGAYDRVWRYFNMNDAALVTGAVLPITAMLLAVRWLPFGFLRPVQLPYTVILIEMGLFLALANGARVLRRVSFESARQLGGTQTRALLVGNESTLVSAVRHVSHHPTLKIVGLLAPEQELRGLRIGGFTVLGQPAVLPEMLASGRVDLVLLADAGLDCIAEAVETATEYGAEVRLLPSASDVIGGEVKVSTPPKPGSELLGRSVLQAAPHPSVVEAFRHRVVLITGAGGSIGSELSRQAARLPVRSLVLVDQDENSIFEINTQLQAAGVEAPIAQVVGDIRDQVLMRRVFEMHRPHIVLHAAAYKHVPVMEQNCSGAVLNNVVGTRQLADLAIEYGSERFLMISTDKAVNPTSVMGASKRLAEMLVQARATAANGTRCACVRFGNVVGSRGSVVPIFLRQIEAGGPVTITDEQMTRYFMTIPEAVQLVLQAATLGSRGDVYMLDMGDPVKITALARKLIQMSGLRPGKDIEIRFVGARPGEKIHEQLWTEGASVSPTDFARVFAVHPEPMPPDFHPRLAELERAAHSRDEELTRHRLQAMPISFRREAPAASFAIAVTPGVQPGI